MVASCHVGVGTCTWVLWKSNKCSYPWNRLPSSWIWIVLALGFMNIAMNILMCVLRCLFNVLKWVHINTPVSVYMYMWVIEHMSAIECGRLRDWPQESSLVFLCLSHQVRGAQLNPDLTDMANLAIQLSTIWRVGLRAGSHGHGNFFFLLSKKYVTQKLAILSIWVHFWWAMCVIGISRMFHHSKLKLCT